ncbi:MAG: hypothetical protein EGQ38_01990 [Dialister sp.]|nr:hypothetical protein [Dialister sp.]
MRRLREHPSAADAVSLPQWGRLRYENTAFLDTTPFPSGKGEEEAASPLKKEANLVSLRSAAPSKGRGSRGHSLLPMEGGAPKGRRLDGGSGMKEREIVSSTPFAKAPYPPLRGPPSPMGKAAIREYRFSRHNAFPAWGRLNRQRLRREYIWGDARRSAESRFPVYAFLT